jgi:hypothetical protein
MKIIEEADNIIELGKKNDYLIKSQQELLEKIHFLIDMNSDLREENRLLKTKIDIQNIYDEEINKIISIFGCMKYEITSLKYFGYKQKTDLFNDKTYLALEQISNKNNIIYMYPTEINFKNDKEINEIIILFEPYTKKSIMQKYSYVTEEFLQMFNHIENNYILFFGLYFGENKISKIDLQSIEILIKNKKLIDGFF